VLKSTPPYTSSHLTCQEQSLLLARQQVIDLSDHRLKMKKESDHVNEVWTLCCAVWCGVVWCVVCGVVWCVVCCAVCCAVLRCGVLRSTVLYCTILYCHILSFYLTKLSIFFLLLLSFDLKTLKREIIDKIIYYRGERKDLRSAVQK
jgi:hypothetical protein